jgi:ribA/ribD-fused uncharacterized protein
VSERETLGASTSPREPHASYHRLPRRLLLGGNTATVSNFSESPVVFDGQTYPTVERAFQAAKTFDAEQRQLICEAPTPAAAKRLGRAVTSRADWEQVKFDIMYGLRKQKFAWPD